MTIRGCVEAAFVSTSALVAPIVIRATPAVLVFCATTATCPPVRLIDSSCGRASYELRARWPPMAVDFDWIFHLPVRTMAELLSLKRARTYAGLIAQALVCPSV